MTRTGRGIVIFLICAIAAVTIGVALRNQEPRYEGKSLSQWLHQANLEQRGSRPYGDTATKAIRDIGTNAIPFLLRRILYKPLNWQFSTRVLREFEFRREQHADEAVTGFYILGDRAKGAIPDLARALADEKNYNASYALGYIGKDSVSVLIDLLTNRTVYTNFSPRYLWPAWTALGTNALLTIPVLLAHLDDRDIPVARASAELLGTFGETQIEADAIIPALAKSLDSTNLWDEAAHSLSFFKGRARPALPSLLRALNADPSTRFYLTNTINEIDPEALKQLSRGQSDKAITKSLATQVIDTSH